MFHLSMGHSMRHSILTLEPFGSCTSLENHSSRLILSITRKKVRMIFNTGLHFEQDRWCLPLFLMAALLGEALSGGTRRRAA